MSWMAIMTVIFVVDVPDGLDRNVRGICNDLNDWTPPAPKYIGSKIRLFP
jgi:hypothetical protein